MHDDIRMQGAMYKAILSSIWIESLTTMLLRFHAAWTASNVFKIAISLSEA